ncbi:hypothetical protein LXA43DRAFT_50128 [Ganoderma leucocontextum]|nr:hypothetical protein LXA43DRAFT_50128 [Ganoderma leucocontextum]
MRRQKGLLGSKACLCEVESGGREQRSADRVDRRENPSCSSRDIDTAQLGRRKASRVGDKWTSEITSQRCRRRDSQRTPGSREGARQRRRQRRRHPGARKRARFSRASSRWKVRTTSVPECVDDPIGGRWEPQILSGQKTTVKRLTVGGNGGRFAWAGTCCGSDDVMHGRTQCAGCVIGSFRGFGRGQAGAAERSVCRVDFMAPIVDQVGKPDGDDEWGANLGALRRRVGGRAYSVF